MAAMLSIVITATITTAVIAKRQPQLTVHGARRVVSGFIVVAAAFRAVITDVCTGQCSPCFTASLTVGAGVVKEAAAADAAAVGQHVNRHLKDQLSSC